MSDPCDYVGEWSIEPDSAGAMVHYTLETKPRGVPGLLGPMAVRRNVQRLLEDLRAQMLRRGHVRWSGD